jgi:hypothetical protein
VKRASIKENLAAIDRVVQRLNNIARQLAQTDGVLNGATTGWQVSLRALF